MREAWKGFKLEIGWEEGDSKKVNAEAKENVRKIWCKFLDRWLRTGRGMKVNKDKYKVLHLAWEIKMIKHKVKETFLTCSYSILSFYTLKMYQNCKLTCNNSDRMQIISLE